MNIENILYDEEAAAAYIGGVNSPVSTRTMQRWRLEGVGPAYVKLGRLVRYRNSDLDTFLEDRVRYSTSTIDNGSKDECRASRKEGACHD